MKNKNTNPTKLCVKCGSKNVLMTFWGLETDQYKCENCGEEWLVSDIRRISGYKKKETEEMDRNK